MAAKIADTAQSRFMREINRAEEEMDEEEVEGLLRTAGYGYLIAEDDRDAWIASPSWRTRATPLRVARSSRPGRAGARYA
jgi:hypothetical protein